MRLRDKRRYHVQPLLRLLRQRVPCGTVYFSRVETGSWTVANCHSCALPPFILGHMTYRLVGATGGLYGGSKWRSLSSSTHHLFPQVTPSGLAHEIS